MIHGELDIIHYFPKLSLRNFGVFFKKDFSSESERNRRWNVHFSFTYIMKFKLQVKLSWRFVSRAFSMLVEGVNDERNGGSGEGV